MNNINWDKLPDELTMEQVYKLCVLGEQLDPAWVSESLPQGLYLSDPEALSGGVFLLRTIPHYRPQDAVARPDAEKLPRLG